MFSFHCFASSCTIFVHVIKLVSELESSKEFTTVVFASSFTVTGITCGNAWNLSGFVKSYLFVELIVA